MTRDDDRDDTRPNPEELLDRYQLREVVRRSEQPGQGDSSGRPRRGRLRLYLGMAAGVGKTYAMLNEGRRRKERGTDVVIGYVETHGRALTAAQIGDLEIVPRTRITYRGVTLEEMDVDAIIQRHPAVALVDELAHTNVPGSRHEKRYEDVADLQDAGITVISTLNIQHLEGLNDIVEAITGVRQRETLPDRVLDEADEVELIDISPDALRSRMRHGNVYPPERAAAALERYFTQSNLTALRELALRRTAEKTESQLETMMRGGTAEKEPAWARTATERVMVAFDARPHSRQLLRDGWRLARGLKAPLIAVSIVESASGDARRQTPAGGGQRSELDDLVQLAEDLGAEVMVRGGRDVARELAEVARERHVTQIVVGQPLTSRWQSFLRGSVVDRLLREPTGADIHVVPWRAEREE